jgi:hypothetical protein
MSNPFLDNKHNTQKNSNTIANRVNTSTNRNKIANRVNNTPTNSNKKNGNVKNTNKNVKNSNNSKKGCEVLPDFDPNSDKSEQFINLLTNRLKNLLTNMNNGLFGNKEADKILIGLLTTMNNEQKTLRKRQEIMKKCLDNYNDILNNYNNQSIKIENFEKIAKSLGLNNPKQPSQIFN